MSESAIPHRFPSNPGDVICAAMKPLMEMQLGVRLTFAERLDAEVLARATRLLLDLEPVLGCWPDEGFKGVEWVRCDDLDSWESFTLTETIDADGDAAAFYSAGLHGRGPRLGVKLLRSAEHDDICILIDHLAGDGWSVKEVAHLLAETYTRLLADPEYVPRPCGTRPGPSDVWAALSSKQRAATTNVPPMVFSKMRMKVAQGPTDTFRFHTVTLPAEDVALARAYAHERSASVNEALLAAAARSIAALYPQKPGVKLGLAVSADMRRVAGDQALDRISNISTVQTILVEASPDESFDASLAAVVSAVKPFRDSLWSAGMYEKPEGPALWGLHMMFSAIGAFARATHSGAACLINLGAFDEARLGFGAIHPISAFATGEVLRYGGFLPIVSGFRGALTFCIGAREKWLAPAAAEEFLARVRHELATTTNQPITL